MKPSFFKAALGAGLVLAAGLASAQSETDSFYFNVTGNNSVPVAPITAVAGGTLNLTLYVTSNFNFTGVQGLLGFSSSTTQGPGATLTDTRLAYGSGSYTSEFSGSSLQSLNGDTGGGGVASGTARPAGAFGAAALNSGTYASGTGIAIYNVTLNVNAAAGQTIPVYAWSAGSSAAFTSYLTDATGKAVFPSGAFTQNVFVTSVPEPATLAALGLGLLILRRRRSSK